MSKNDRQKGIQHIKLNKSYFNQCMIVWSLPAQCFEEKQYVLKQARTINMQHFVECGSFCSNGCFLCPVSSLRHEQQTLIIHLSEKGFFCLTDPYRGLFKNRGRWLEFNVRVIAWSTALIFVFEWGGCIAKLPITVISETLPSHFFSSLDRNVESIDCESVLGFHWFGYRMYSNASPQV